MYGKVFLGNHEISRVSYNDVQPGDILQTYESLTTRSDLRGLQVVLDWINHSHAHELIKMFHSAIVVKKYPRTGIFQIAHADGSSKTMSLTEDDFRAHHPGQVLIFFRLKNPMIRHEIIEIATQTSQLNNGHLCRVLNLNSLFCQMICVVRMGYVENLVRKASEGTLKRLSEMSVEYLKSGRFYGTGRKGTREMSCLEYVANVVNIATLRTLYPETLTFSDREQRIETIFKAFQEMNQEKIELLKFSTTLASPAEFVDRLLKGPEKFKTVGYLGAYSEPLEGDPLDIERMESEAKNEDEAPREKGVQRGEMSCMSEQRETGSTDSHMTLSLLELEKERILKSSLDRTAKTLRLSMNTLDQERLAAQWWQKKGERLAGFAEWSLKTIILSPLYIISSTIASLIRTRSENRLTACETKRRQILIAHERIRKNVKVFLEFQIDEREYRPWFLFRIGSDGEWFVEPLEEHDEVWMCRFRLLKGENVEYRVFLGSICRHDTDPIGRAVAWREERGVIDHRLDWDDLETMDSLTKRIHLKVPFKWVEPVINRERPLFVARYFYKCHNFAPETSSPLTVSEYEAPFAKFERTLESIVVEGGLLEVVQGFCNQILGMSIETDSILSLSSGLGKGLSGDRLFIVVDKKSLERFVIKVFMRPIGKCMREFYTLMMHEKLSLHHLYLPKVQGVGSVALGEKRFLLLAMEYKSGTSLYDFFKEYLSLSGESIEKKTHFQRLMRIYKNMGEGIGELELSAKTESLPVHPAYVNLLNSFLQKAIAKLQKNMPKEEFEELKIFVESQKCILTSLHMPRGYFHGDLNAGNFLYNPFLDRLALVDWPDGSLSVGKNGKPMGFPVFNVVQIKDELINRQAQGMKKEEVDLLFRMFLEGYTDVGGVLPAPEVFTFFTTIDLLGSLKWYYDKQDRFRPEDLTMASAQYQAKLARLQELIHEKLGFGY